MSWAVCDINTEEIIGCVGFQINKRHLHAELGYWIKKELWNKGFCYEATKTCLQYVFTQTSINKVFAQHFAKNPASGKVLQKLGMQKEGSFKEHYRKNGVFIDAKLYGLTKQEWNKQENRAKE